MDTFRRDGLTFDVTDTAPAGRPGEVTGGQVALCLHGFPQDRSAWDGVAPRLAAAGVRVLAPDQRGYSPGARPRGRRPYALPELVADAVALLDAVGVARAHVVGHDWGGVVAWALAARHPDRVASLTALSQAHPAAMVGAVTRSDQLLRSAYVLGFQVPWLPERVLLRRGGRGLRETLRRTGLADELAAGYALRAGEGGRLTAALGWYRALPFSGGVGRVGVPVTYLSGRDDPFYARAAVEGTADLVRGPYEHRVLPTGHWVPEREPDAVVAAVLAHVRRR
ncbi:alpha/beta fold hydrolase [Pseudokineococcus lusitanus]|uniref:Pimeloyl-ACP methyl ester carboxylesterase n=1 Tax=Pseudokineococcus lusitanus TaxID=763993 RepID=A0A3N1HT23_9ACTN|nr:alpha/beta hydrolase [Pseudokineococcus lusitanus]ROP45570.1 pimeloyl-ACP methyl ester carboxylesterase [Pseudokineococcus lusitanus]